MSLRDDVEQTLRAMGTAFVFWGRHGQEVCAEIEKEIGVQLGGELTAFVSEIGNLRIDPFALTITGDEQGSIGSVRSTRIMRQREPRLPASWIQVMDHAGEVFVVDAKHGKVFAFDGIRVREGEETLKWESLLEFVRWMAAEARAINQDPRFSS
ncbi:MAG: SMI1/KNR4 family protein [Verrucomicrobiae bacterium]|nr:SMI1/KNR4 family protein [Verrucomicrobiae bacterium]